MLKALLGMLPKAVIYDGTRTRSSSSHSLGFGYGKYGALADLCWWMISRRHGGTLVPGFVQKLPTCTQLESNQSTCPPLKDRKRNGTMFQKSCCIVA